MSGQGSVAASEVPPQTVQYLQVQTTTDSRVEAMELARGAVEERLAACAQVAGTIASRSIDSSGLSRRRLTVQHSGGRSSGWIVPDRRCLATLLSTSQSCSMLPGQRDRSSSFIASGEQVSLACWLSLARKKGTSSCRSSMWCRSGASSTLLGKWRKTLVRSAVLRL